MSTDEINKLNAKNDLEHQKQATAFKEGYKKDICYLCNKPFKTITTKDPCLHWLLRRGKFKKKDFPEIYKKFGYGNIAAFLRWCANQERLLSNINDLKEEKSDRKIISYTIKWKNIEWTFDYSKNDFGGHKGTSIHYPHYHFQMRIDGRQFINFNDFHIPFNDYDLFVLKTEMEQEWFKHDFGGIGSGMQEAMSVKPELALEYMTNSENEEQATYHLSTMVDTRDNPISGELIYEIGQESKRTGKPMALLLKERLKGTSATIETTVSPADSIPDIASRTEHKRR